jgi:hypothetical protein
MIVPNGFTREKTAQALSILEVGSRPFWTPEFKRQLLHSL